MTTQRLTAAALAGLALATLLGTGAWAQTQTQPAGQDHVVHHPGAAETAQAAPAPAQPLAPAPMGTGPAAAAPGMPGGGMMPGMMGGGPGQAMPMMPMMQMMPMMMQMMQGMGPGGDAMMSGPGGLPALGRVEGRLAFLRAELGITEAQAGPWGAFADAVRGATAKLREAMAAAPAPAAQPLPAPQQMQRRIALLAAQLEASRSVAAALGPLHAVLSEQQKRTADELLGAHPLGMRMRGF